MEDRGRMWLVKYLEHEEDSEGLRIIVNITDRSLFGVYYARYRTIYTWNIRSMWYITQSPKKVVELPN
jgi:hypothetical protein